MGDVEEKHVLTRMGIFNCQVCSAGSIQEALEWLQYNHPAGTQNNWKIDDRDCVKPVKCNSDDKRKHYVFTC
jgi:hypothetical protein